MKIFLTFSILLSLLVDLFHSALVTTADFLQQPEYTRIYIANNYLGYVNYLDDVIPNMNTTNFQGFFLNGNLNGQWYNNFQATFRMPRDWYYNCTAVGIN